jgi:4-amino-4-deoxy-L-arabinose transferase-like glycosyltransferase
MPIATLEKTIKKYRNYVFGTIVVLACFIFLYQLGTPAFWDYDEGTYAQVMHDTAASGDYLSLQALGGSWFEKPPLYFWAGMMAGSVIPSKEFAYRLPAAISGILGVVLVMLIAFALTENYAIAAAAGIIMLTSPAFVEASRQVRLDASVTLAILFSVFSFVRGLKNETWYAGVGVGLALGVLTKSVIGLFPIGFIAIWALVNRDLSLLRSKSFWIGIGLMFVIALPWHIYETMTFGHAFWDSYFLHHVVDRAEVNIIAGGNLSNALYVYVLATFAAPWPIVFLIGVLAMPFQRTQNMDFKIEIVLASFVAVILAAFFAAGTKISYYLMPLYPFIALFIALQFWQLAQWATKSRTTTFSIQAVALIVTIVAFANTIFVGFNYVRAFQINEIISNEERDAGHILAANPMPQAVYTYDWDYWDTVRYYGDGRTIGKMQDDQALTDSFFLIMHTEGGYQFPPEMQRHLETVYTGRALTMYKFTI